MSTESRAYKKRAPAATTTAMAPNSAKFLTAAPVYSVTGDVVVGAVMLEYVPLATIETAGIARELVGVLVEVLVDVFVTVTSAG